MISELVLYLVGFILFLPVQSLAINGWHECFRNGNIFEKIFGAFLEKHKGKWWTMPIWGCVKCESSVIGSITFWFTVIPIFGFHSYEIWIWVVDIFCLVNLNYWFYKTL